MRAWLVGTSLFLHLGLIFGVFVAGTWRIDRLDPAKHRIEVYLPLPPPPAASGAVALSAQPFSHKRHVVHELVSPEPRVAEAPAVVDSMTGTGTGEGSGSGDDPTGAGSCTENCGPGSDASPPVVEVPRIPKPPAMVAPTVLRGLWLSGETQVQASDVVKMQIVRDGKDAVSAMFKVCVDAGGGVSSVARLRGTGYPSYDDQLAAAIHGWRYRPSLANGVAIPVCGVVTFIYAMK